MTERTSARVARIAAKVLAMNAPDGRIDVVVRHKDHSEAHILSTLKWRDIRALAASCLTQSPPKGITHRQKAFKAAPERRKP